MSKVLDLMEKFLPRTKVVLEEIGVPRNGNLRILIVGKKCFWNGLGEGQGLLISHYDASCIITEHLRAWLYKERDIEDVWFFESEDGVGSYSDCLLNACEAEIVKMKKELEEHEAFVRIEEEAYDKRNPRDGEIYESKSVEEVLEKMKGRGAKPSSSLPKAGDLYRVKNHANKQVVAKVERVSPHSVALTRVSKEPASVLFWRPPSELVYKATLDELAEAFGMESKEGPKEWEERCIRANAELLKVQKELEELKGKSVDERLQEICLEMCRVPTALFPDAPPCKTCEGKGEILIKDDEWPKESPIEGDMMIPCPNTDCSAKGPST